MALLPNPPAITEMKERFMALHMMKERIAPEEPTSAPVTIKRSLESIKPAAAAPDRNISSHGDYHWHIGSTNRRDWMQTYYQCNSVTID